jgi:hypothetical protein
MYLRIGTIKYEHHQLLLGVFHLLDIKNEKKKSYPLTGFGGL